MTQSHHSQRRYYLSDIPLEEARDRFYSALLEAGALEPLSGEAVPLAMARGRITASPIWAVSSSPHYDAAAMDGIAVRAADTTGATETSPITLAVGGPEPQAVWMDTGDAMPRGFDAVIMVEHLHLVGDDHVSIMAPVAPWQHVRTLGEDIVATELVLTENHRLTPRRPGRLRRRRPQRDSGAPPSLGGHHPHRQRTRPRGNGVEARRHCGVQFPDAFRPAGGVGRLGNGGGPGPRRFRGHSRRGQGGPVRARPGHHQRGIIGRGRGLHRPGGGRTGPAAGPRHCYPARPPGSPGCSPGQAAGGPARLSGFRHADHGITAQTIDSRLAGAGRLRPAFHRQGKHHPQGNLAVGRGRVPAGEAG